ncbi:MAG TPA: redoxin domain-containing protein [Isosphaeraceae bacterium]|jgi:peroxiredoxin|nr:redoxin domain-containing protein [Isosphaeraceae bacterium]
MRTTILSLTALALVAAPVFAGKFNTVVSVGQKAPDFSGIPAVQGDKDTTINLKDIKEDVVVLCFSANHCPVVHQYEDRMVDFAKKYEGKGVKFVAVCVEHRDEDRLPAIKEYLKGKGASYTYGYDDSQKIGREYGATNTPQFFVLDKSRTIRYMGAMDNNANEGKVTKHYLADAVDAVLKGESPEVQETQPKGCGINLNK